MATRKRIPRLTKEQAEEYMARWEMLRNFELEERRDLSPAESHKLLAPTPNSDDGSAAFPQPLP